MAKKYDAVLEAVHFAEDGKIDWVRVYERMGAVYSDRLIWKREILVDKLKRGANILTGKRIYLMGNSFEVGDSVRLVEKDGKSVVVLGEAQSDKDSLDSVPRI
jgi:hypothetical protein